MLCYSRDYARTRLANDLKRTKKDGGERKYNGLIDVYRIALATDSIVGLYRGFVASCVGIIIYRDCYFCFYDTLKPIILGADAGIMLSFLLGYGVTVTSGQTVKYKGSMDFMCQILRQESVMSLFKMLMPIFSEVLLVLVF